MTNYGEHQGVEGGRGRKLSPSARSATNPLEPATPPVPPATRPSNCSGWPTGKSCLNESTSNPVQRTNACWLKWSWLSQSATRGRSVIDIAMTLLTCPECGHELGSRYQECTACYLAFGQALASEYGVTGNEHALHIGRWILRHPHQHSQNILTAWRGSVPRLLTGWLPTTAEAQRGMAQIKRGKATDH